jgi:hypothetical protein
MPAPAKLVTLTQAKAQLEITLPDGDPGDAQIQDMLNEAEAIILGRVKGAGGAPADWVDPASAPGPITQAIKLELTRMYTRRGDDDTDHARFEERITYLLTHYLTPGIA